MHIRKAAPQDMKRVMELIHELAEFERAPNEVTNTSEQLIKDGFGERPLFECLVLEKEDRIVGISLYYYRYSTWKGKQLYLEDLIITQNERKKGLGKLLLDATLAIARENNCSGARWQVLDWNSPAIDFYKSLGGKLDEEWINVSLEIAKE